MTVLRACIDCGTPSSGPRCPRHQQLKQRTRTGNRDQARAVVLSSPRCVYCGSTRDLTSDHVQPLAPAAATPAVRSRHAARATAHAAARSPATNREEDSDNPGR